MFLLSRMSADEVHTVTMKDILGDEELHEAYAVLAGSDPDNCSYPQGYVKRQAIFACNTCTPRGIEPAGLCLACTNHCHDGHDIFELYTKRNFRCDCGNGKFGEFKCQLNPDKDRQNIKNQYNHNFHGCYCTCDRPYPDTEDQVNEDMIQCIICEDWYHPRHLACVVEDSDELQEMVCETCMNKAPFLWTYAAHFADPPMVNVSPCKEEVEVNVQEDEEPFKKRTDEPCNNGDEGSSTSPSYHKQVGRSACKRTYLEMTGRPVKSPVKTVFCRLRELKTQGVERTREGAVFWPYHWRAKLCTCISCKRAYVEAGVQFLLDESDTVLAYENRGIIEEGSASFDSLLMSGLSALDRVQQLEIVYQFNEMQTELMAFLRQIADEGKVVTAEAIHQFFGELMSKKRRQMNS
ncbi:putative E3 ubiquitin-protein ligase UBR7 [Esox lucius]|uniref:putative E3 ubiquitin-protein ligase UBR7 n=1 Tax=Esox lucius TaxID=8010 RepID=UPI00057680CE|nr:putative E3 ubiquitin-protein ligase UBR7 [Esox lucius]